MQSCDNVEIIFANKNLIKSLKGIWKICFGDDNNYIDMFFDNYFDKQQALVYLINKKPVSMMFMIDCSFIYNKKVCKGKYIYAVATLPEHRSKGISTKLISYANAYLKDIGADFTVLVPANKDLFDFYKKMGYKTQFYIENLSYKQVPFGDIEFISINENKYFDKRNNILKDKFIKWDKEFFKYALLETKFQGGDFVSIQKDKKEIGIMAFNVYKNNVYVKEFLCDNKDEVMSSFMKKYSFKSTKIRCKCSKECKNKVPFAMSFWYEKKEIPDGYISIVLD